MKTQTKPQHREDGPAVIEYNESGNIAYESYYLNDMQHRENGPAEISYYESGKIKGEYWYKNNRMITQDLKDAHYFESTDEMKAFIWEMI